MSTHKKTSNSPWPNLFSVPHLALAGAVLSAACLGGAALLDEPVQPSETRSMKAKCQDSPPRHVTASATFQTDIKSRTGIHIINGDRFLVDMKDGEVLKVVINGQEVPLDRVHTENGRMIVFDEDGNELKSMHLLTRELDRDFMFKIMRKFDAKMSDMIDVQAGGGYWVSTGRPDFTPPPVMIGIHTRHTDPALEHHLGLEPNTTVMVSTLHKGLPAELAGLTQYDIILSFDDTSPVSRQMIFEKLREKEPGENLEMTVIQKGETMTFTLELEPFDFERMRNAERIGSDSRRNRRSRMSFNWREENEFGQSNRIIFSPRDLTIFTLPSGQDMFSNPEEIRMLLRGFNLPKSTQKAKVILRLEGSSREMRKDIERLKDPLPDSEKSDQQE